jgi:hypothetical protein
VTFTASARMSTPRSMRWRASPLKRTSLAAIVQIPLGYFRIGLDRKRSSTSESA